MHHSSQHVAVTLLLIGMALVYVRIWIRRSMAASSLARFVSGLAVLWIAVASPLASLDDELLIAHMLQHLLIMTVAAPLILLGAPGRPRRCFIHPVICWMAGTAVVLVWHVPRAFELGMSSGVWHSVEQASFLAAGILFWWPIVQFDARLPDWSAPLYLFLATLPCDALSAFLTFCDRVMYPSYLSVDRHFPLSALQDQQWAGTLMWVWVTFAYLAPAAFITLDLLAPRVTSAVEYSRRA